MSGRVFISYRREDTQAWAGRVFDRLVERFGRQQIFMDVDTIEPGADFVTVLEDAVGKCQVLLALIGKGWTSATGASGRRLDDPNDIVAIEIAAALRRDIRVIPLLVDGAQMPSAGELPAALQGLARRNALEFGHSRFPADMDRLIRVLSAPAGPAEEALPRPGQESTGRVDSAAGIHFPEEWETLEELGRGELGHVYRARHRLTGEIVTLKCMAGTSVTDAEVAARHARSVRVSGGISHPRIVRLLHSGLVGGRPWLALEYVDGHSLRKWMGGGPVPASKAVAVAIQLAEALAYLHGEGVVHRDVRPENVLVDRAEQLKLANFGRAWSSAGPVETGGTPPPASSRPDAHYVAPEQRAEPTAPTPAEDLYAMGVLLFEMLVGRPPYGAERPGETQAGLPAELDELVGKMLARSPASRPQSANDVLRRLRPLATPKVPAEPVRVVPPEPPAAAALDPVVLSDREWINERDGSVMVRIPEGSFSMGSDDGYFDERPVHLVTLGGYSIAKTEVTWAQYRAFCRATRRKEPDPPGFEHDERHPVVNVSWEEAAAYCEWAGLRLPTEAEWEYAARGTDGRRYPWGNDAPDEGAIQRARFESGPGSGKRYKQTAPVGSYPAGVSAFGVLDMAGNVWEWCHDWKSDYPAGPVRDPRGPVEGAVRVLRGGGWYNDARTLRATVRRVNATSYRSHSVGFRCAK